VLGKFLRRQVRVKPLGFRAVQIREEIWFSVQIIRGLYAIGGLRENRVGFG
jgi:hypothetical protein